MDVINNPSQSITMLEKAISDVAGYRSKYGAIQNRMEESLNMIEIIVIMRKILIVMQIA